jgi:hypothetical protein
MIGRTFQQSFGDKRLDERGNEIIRNLLVKGTHSVRQFSQNSAQQKGSYRFLENERTTEDVIIQSMSNRCAMAVKNRVVLSIQDTTEINLYNHKNRIKQDDSIGVTNAAKNGLGFMLHPSLVVDAANCFPYGFCHVHLFNRPLEREPKETRNKHLYKQLNIEEKESNKWVSSSKAAKAALKEAAAVIIVQDREGDIYEQFATIPDDRTHLLIRAKSDRSLPEGGKLFGKVSSCDVAGTYSIRIEGDKRKGQQKRIANLEVRFTEVEINNSSRTAKQIAPTVKLWCVEAREVNSSVKQPVCWRLLTTISIQSVAMAALCIEWYSWRWMIEEVFKILKKEGYNIEASELEYASSVRKMCLMIMEVVIKLFLMRLAYAEPEVELSATTCFTEDEQEFLEHQITRLEGKTEKQKNPYKAHDLKRYTWAIARLGGWKGYESKRHPGITTLWIGMKYFKAAFEGWEIMRNVSTR